MIELNDKNWKEEVIGADIPVVVDFWAPWCGPCKMFSPTFEAVSKEFEGKVKFVKLNTQDYPAPAQENGVRGIPCVIVFNEGKEIERIVGAFPEPMFKKKITEILANS